MLLNDDFAVILLDVLMPGMDGFETARLIRKRKRNENTQIIFITAVYQSEEHIVKGYNLGAVDYLFKPFHPEALKLEVEKIVELHLKSQQIMLQNDLLTLQTAELKKMNDRLEENEKKSL